MNEQIDDSSSGPRTGLLSGVRVRRTLFFRISLAFFILTLGATTANGFICYSSWKRYSDVFEQILNWDLAESLLYRFRPYLTPTVDRQKIEDLMYEVSTTNRRIEVFVLDEKGSVVVARLLGFRHPDVPLQPIEEFLALQGQPGKAIYGRDPTQPPERDEGAVFSVARTPVGNGQGYLYVTLLGGGFNTVRAAMADMGSIWVVFFAALASVVFTSGLGSAVFYWITRRFRLMTRVLERFERGDYSTRIPFGSTDEIGLHANAFNKMADTIEANIETLTLTDSLRRELVANVSHDLRRPLARMQTQLETLLMKNGVYSPIERQEMLSKTLASCEGLNAHISDLFELSKLNARETVPDTESFSIEELADDLVVKFELLAAAREVTVACESSSDLPFALGDIALLDRALSNLIENAIYYTPQGGTVTVGLSEAKEKIQVQIRDTGIGIPPEDLEHVFDRFYRSANSMAKEPLGTGLGLPIASKIVEAHGSRLEVASVLGSGTTFHFTLEIAKEL